jgi:hypothetical protein
MTSSWTSSWVCHIDMIPNINSGAYHFLASKIDSAHCDEPELDENGHSLFTTLSAGLCVYISCVLMRVESLDDDLALL